MSPTSRYAAFFSYLLNLPGALIVLLTRRNDPFAVFHARQSLALAVTAVVTPLAWAVVAWLLAWIPTVGPLLGVVLFALVLAVYTGIIIAWVCGMVYSLTGQVRALPLIGGWVVKRRAAPPATAVETNPEFIERITPSDV